ncbi:carboxypeptidase-like regulatory domain-containing protein [Mucilaginibacter sp. McL0603]|uniref:carboxypeptidase-like regulatory domain-containing protein n=1 Tax=Mucilaginibacter sp. McL0603 TaxID=3415670 RepID=UPI003CF33D31
MQRILFFLLVFLPFTTLGQHHLAGKILNQADKKPVANASVFLSNATAGAKTNEDGTYEITGVHSGRYELVVSIIGYETYRQTLMVNRNIALPDIEIIPKAIALKEVDIRPDLNRERNYKLFEEEFLGQSDYAKQCKILNSDMLDIHYDEQSRQLTASSFDFIEIENKALGYKIKYLLTQFTRDYRNGLLFYEGSALFEELPDQKMQRRWQKARLKVYNGSSMHFLRSVIANRITEEKFKVFRLVRKLNPDYNGSGRKYLETVYKTLLTTSDFVKTTDDKGLFALEFEDCLSITRGDLSTNIIFEKPYSLFDNNGVFLDPASVTFEGDWGKNRMAELLPVDYYPQ